MTHLLKVGLPGLVMAGAAAFLFALQAARADTFVSQLNCPIISGAACTSTTASYGTITFSDNDKDVDIGIVLAAGLTIGQIVLNYDETKFSNSTPFISTINGTSSVGVQNAEKQHYTTRQWKFWWL